jgi:hypothetical protein
MSEEEAALPRRGVGNRTLTQKYDMSAVRAIQTIEEKKELVKQLIQEKKSTTLDIVWPRASSTSSNR